jgi:hypothetical protein
VGAVEGILATGSLSKAGDTVLGGTEIGVRDGHIKKPFDRINSHTTQQEKFNPNQIFSRQASGMLVIPMFTRSK